MNHKSICFCLWFFLCDCHQFEVCIDLWPHFSTYKSTKLRTNCHSNGLHISFHIWSVRAYISSRIDFRSLFCSLTEFEGGKKRMFPFPSGILIFRVWTNVKTIQHLVHMNKKPMVETRLHFDLFHQFHLYHSMRDFIHWIHEHFPTFARLY